MQDAGNSCRQDVYDSVSVSESWHVRHRRSDIFAAARAYQHLLTSRKGRGQHLRGVEQDCGSGVDCHTNRKPGFDGNSPEERATSLDQELARSKLGCGKFRNRLCCALGLIGLPQRNTDPGKPSTSSQDVMSENLKRYTAYMRTRFPQWGMASAESLASTASADDGDDVRDDGSVSLTIVRGPAGLTFQHRSADLIGPTRAGCGEFMQRRRIRQRFCE